MSKDKLYLVMVGLPARGKSTVANKLKVNLAKEGIKTRIFNNGTLRRQMYHRYTPHPSFFSDHNQEGVDIRTRLARINIDRARKFLAQDGRVAILDATNVQAERRAWILETLTDHPLLFLECINDDQAILRASIQRKIRLPEFDMVDPKTAEQYFLERIKYYEARYIPVSGVPNRVRLDTLNNSLIQEKLSNGLPYYDIIRDLLVTENIRNLYLIRHGETFFNLENRIGGDSPLTPRGEDQARRLARHFSKKRISVIFTSQKRRTIRMAEFVKEQQERCTIIPLKEFDEIDSGICECMSYEEIRDKMPEVYNARKKNKFEYIYPQGEGYATMDGRIDRGLKMALYLGDSTNNIMIVGHRAANRMILSHFLYRRREDVPYIYIPQDKYYRIVSMHSKKLFELKPF